MFTVNRNPDRRELAKFGSAMLIGFGAIGLILWCSANVGQGRSWFAWIGGVRQLAAIVAIILGVSLFALSRISHAATKTVYVSWMSVMVPVGVAVSTIMLTALFALVLPLFALIVKRSDPLRKKLTLSGSYWEPFKPIEPTLERMRRLF